MTGDPYLDELRKLKRQQLKDEAEIRRLYKLVRKLRSLLKKCWKLKEDA